MKNGLILCWVGLLALATGCSREEETLMDGRPTLSLTTRVEAATRATDLAFEQGDQFGLVVLNRTGDEVPSLDGVRYFNNGLCTQTAEGVEMSTVKYPEQAVDLYAYYPYREDFTQGRSFVFTVEPDQSVGRNYTNSDLMSAVRQNVSPTDDPVVLTFAHRMSRLDVVLQPGEGFASADELAGATVTVKQVLSSCEFDLGSGLTSRADTPVDMIPSGNGAVVAGNATEPMRLLVVPQTLPAGETLFEIALEGETFLYVPDSELLLEGGRFYRFEIRQNRAAASTTSARISSMPM